MKKEIIPIEFKEGQYKAYDESLKQWNHSQKLAISGLDISDEIVEVHFSLQEYGGGAKRMVGTVIDGVIHVGIPVFILEGPEWSSEYYNAYAWIYLSDEESAETVRKIEFTIEARPKPDEYVTPEELTFLQQLELAIKNKLDKSGHAPNKFLGTDEKGNVVTKEQEEFNLGVANEEKLGGVKPLNKTDDMTLEVGVDKDGRLFAKGKDITVDSKLSEESENPVQNKVLTKEVNTLKEHNAKLKETIEKLQIKVTTEKASFHNIKDSANMKVLDFGMEGKTEQETTSGNQLIDISKIELTNTGNIDITEVGENHIVITSYDGYSGNGLIGTGKTLKELCPLLEVGETYLLTATTYSTDNTRIYVGITWQFGKTMVMTEEALNAQVILYGHNYTTTSTIGSCKISNIQIQKGTTELPIEPFTNGPSPNPDYPQEIVNAGVYNEETGRYEHKFYAGNKNLLKLTGRNVLPEQDSASTVAREFTGNQIFVGISANNYMQQRVVKNYSIDDDSITLTTSGGSFGLGFDVPVKEGQTYIISDDNNNVNIKVGFFDSEGNYLSYLTLVGKSFTIPTGASWLIVVFLSATTTETNITNIQLELDTVATEPVIHQSTKFTLTSPVPLTKWDYLTKRDGVWGWSVWSECLNLNGDSGWVATNGNKGFYCECLPTNYSIRDAYCSQLINDPMRDNTVNGLWVGSGNKCVYARTSAFFDNTLSDFGLANWKTHLNENPLDIWYQTAEEQSFHPLPDEEQELLRNLEMYYGVTNLYNDQGCPMWLTYVADTKLYVDQKLLEIQQAMI